MGITSKLFAYVGVVAVATAPVAHWDPSRFTRDARQHLEWSDQAYREGRFEQAIAHAEAIAPIGRIPYRIESASVSPVARLAMQRAEAMWESALGQQIDWSESFADADVVIRFQQEVVSRGVQVGGHTKWLRCVRREMDGYSGRTTADIWARTHCLSGRPLNEAQLAHILAHEMGHVLGLGDSPHPGDIMGRIDLARPVTRPSDEETAQLRLFRDHAVDIRRESLLGVLLRFEGYNHERAAR